MWNQVSRILSQAANRIGDNIANFLPGVLVALVLLIATLSLALVVRFLVLRVLRGLDFDRRLEQVGLGGLAQWAPSQTPALLVARVAFWTLALLGLLVALSALDATMPAQFAMALFQYLPNLLAAALILVVGGLVARFLARSVLISAVNMQIHSARLLSVGVKWLVLVLAGAMALEHIGIGRQILLLAFGILFGGIVLAMALAVGLGSKEMISQSWEQLRERGQSEDRLDHR